jgi:membrane protein YqaA with SNARE-associated domain
VIGAYASLFFSALLAATLLPFYSEVVLVGLLASYPQLWPQLWLAATLGNTIGAAINWLLGRYLLHFQDRRWFPFNPDKLGPAQRWFQRYGVWSLLLSWLPVGGDALTFVAGMMRVPFIVFWTLTLIGKGARYLLVIYLAGQLPIAQ